MPPVSGAGLARARGTWRPLLAGLAASLVVAVPHAAFAQAGPYRSAIDLNVRVAPSIDAALVGVIPPSSRVDVLGCDDFGWCEVRYGDLAGWSARQFLVPITDLGPDAFVLRFGDEATPAPALFVEGEGAVADGPLCMIFTGIDGRQFGLRGNVAPNHEAPVYLVGRPVVGETCGDLDLLDVLYARAAR